MAVSYYQQISEHVGKYFFKSPWGGCILRNCFCNSGELLEFSKINHYEKFTREENKLLWLHLKLKVFKLPTQIVYYGVFVCPQCTTMSAVDGLSFTQSPEDIRLKLCYHSLVASMLIGEWRSFWSVSLSPSDEVFNVFPNPEETFTTFVSQSTETALLAGVLDSNKKISILYCVTSRQEVPFCTSCVRRKCHHYRQFLSYTEQAQGQGEAVSGEVIGEYDPKHDTEEEDFGHEDHYLKPLPKHLHGYMYGYNYTPILYPFSDSSDQQQIWIERIKGIVNIPDRLVPVPDSDYKCKHNKAFCNSDEALVPVSRTLCLISDLGERIFKSEVFARPSEGPCKCLHRVDGHTYGIWNLGHGRFVDYTLLLGYLQKWRGSGISMHALFRSITDCMDSCGVSSSLTYSDLHRSICGFFVNLKFDLTRAFSCPRHGTSPTWIVSDGKALGPLKKRVAHLSELDVAKEDESVFNQSTHYKDRVYLYLKKERVLLVKLLTGDISMEEFTLTDDIKTENGVMIQNLVKYLKEKFIEEIPLPYLGFLKNISKNSSARSLVQVNNVEVLEDLSNYCREEFDIRTIENKDKLKRIMSALPAIWPILDDICTLERTKFLP